MLSKDFDRVVHKTPCPSEIEDTSENISDPDSKKSSEAEQK